MELKSMKLNSEESKEQMPAEVSPDKPQYPYGLRIELSNESIEKLGLSDLPNVGEVKMVRAKVIVERVSQNETVGGEKRRDLSLQITDMCIDGCEEESEPMEKKLYNTDGSVKSPSKNTGKTLLVDL